VLFIPIISLDISMFSFSEKMGGGGREFEAILKPNFKDLADFMILVSRFSQYKGLDINLDWLVSHASEIDSQGECGFDDTSKLKVFKSFKLLRKVELLLRIYSSLGERERDYSEVSPRFRREVFDFTASQLKSLEEIRDFVINNGLVEYWAEIDKKLVEAGESVVYVKDFAGEENFYESGEVDRRMKNLRLSVAQAKDWRDVKKIVIDCGEFDPSNPWDVRDKEIVLLRESMRKNKEELELVPQNLSAFFEILFEEEDSELAEMDEIYFSRTAYKNRARVNSLRNSIYSLDRDIRSGVRLSKQLKGLDLEKFAYVNRKIGRRGFLAMSGGAALSVVGGILVNRTLRYSNLPDIETPNPPNLEIPDVPDELMHLGVPTVDMPESVDNEFSRDTEVMLLARTIFGEARGRSEKLKIAIGFTVLNRMKVRDQELREVVLDPSQYSCFLRSDPNFSLLKNPLSKKLTNEDRAEWPKCFKLAEGLLVGKFKDPTHGATHFHTEVVSGKYEWMNTMKSVGKIENTIFYK